jgi:16S rRNA (uracil1498-N3)-methyltransferase
MSDRYFADEPVTDDRAMLSGPEAHHLLHVMRAKIGAEVHIFDGTGSEFVARVDGFTRSQVELSILERLTINRELAFPVVLGVALPKGDRQKWLVEKAVELGVARIVPVQTARSVAQPTANALERLRRSVIEASKQCGRNRLMEISEPETIDAFLAGVSGAALRLVAHPSGDPLPEWNARISRAGLYVAIGPEGGFTDDETARALAAGWQIVTLGPRILRVETAAIAVASYAALSPAAAARK